VTGVDQECCYGKVVLLLKCNRQGRSKLVRGESMALRDDQPRKSGKVRIAGLLKNSPLLR